MRSNARKTHPEGRSYTSAKVIFTIDYPIYGADFFSNLINRILKSHEIKIQTIPSLAARSLSTNRCTLPVSVLGKASMNSTSRGYLYGASSRLTKS